MSTPWSEELNQPNIVRVQHKFIEISISQFNDVIPRWWFFRFWWSIRYTLELSINLIFHNFNDFIGYTDSWTISWEVGGFVFVNEYFDGRETLYAILTSIRRILIGIDGSYFDNTLENREIIIQSIN